MELKQDVDPPMVHRSDDAAHHPTFEKMLDMAHLFPAPEYRSSLSGPRTRQEAPSALTLRAYPNPASEMLYLTVPMAIENATLEVMDPQGKQVVEHTLAPNSMVHEFDVRSWTAGVYVVRLLSKGVPMDTQRITILR